MRAKYILVVISIVLLSVSLIGCNSSYHKSVEEYESLFSETIGLIDSENIYESINENNLSSNLIRLDKILGDIEVKVPNSKSFDFMVLKQNHSFLKEVIDKGLKWDTIGGLDRLLIKEIIQSYKSNE
jgi:hypothetical protein